MELPKNETIKVDTNINIDEEDFKDLEEDDESRPPIPPYQPQGKHSF